MKHLQGKIIHRVNPVDHLKLFSDLYQTLVDADGLTVPLVFLDRQLDEESMNTKLQEGIVVYLKKSSMKDITNEVSLKTFRIVGEIGDPDIIRTEFKVYEFKYELRIVLNQNYEHLYYPDPNLTDFINIENQILNYIDDYIYKQGNKDIITNKLSYELAVEYDSEKKERIEVQADKSTFEVIMNFIIYDADLEDIYEYQIDSKMSGFGFEKNEI